MGPEFMYVLAVVMVAWGIGVAIKAGLCLQKGETYVFALWDGGMIRVGKRLTKFGAQLKVAVGGLMALACIVLLVGALPPLTSSYLLMFLGLFSVVADFVTAESN